MFTAERMVYTTKFNVYYIVAISITSGSSFTQIDILNIFFNNYSVNNISRTGSSISNMYVNLCSTAFKIKQIEQETYGLTLMVVNYPNVYLNYYSIRVKYTLF